MSNNRLLIIGIPLIVLLALAQFVIVPLSEWEKQQADEIAMLKKKTLKINDIWEHKELIESQHKELTQILTSTLEQFELIDENEIPGFQLEKQKVVEQLSSSTGVMVNQISWLDPVQDLLTEIPLKLSGTGSPEAVVRFVLAIEQRGRTVEMKEFRVRVGSGDSELIMDLTLSFYAVDKKYKTMIGDAR